MPTVRVEAITDPTGLIEQFAGVYHSALSTLDDSTDLAAAQEWARTVLPRHTTREAFRCFGAFDDGAGHGASAEPGGVNVGARGELVGFIYGYHGATGQYWEDWLAQRIPPHVFARWITDHFALVEFHVHGDRHGEGIGSRLYEALFSEAVRYPRAVLTTRNGDTPARRFYEHRGWQLVRTVTARHSLLGLEPVHARPPVSR